MVTLQRKLLLLLLVVVPWLMPLAPGQAEEPAPIIGRLLVFVNGGCPYCRRFHAEVATLYQKTRIGKRLPLSEVDLELPDEPFERLAKSVRFVPTFVVLDAAGREQGRFRGYRSEESFWAELEAAYHGLECRESIATGKGAKC